MTQEKDYYLQQAFLFLMIFSFILGYVYEIPGCIGFCMGNSLALSIINFKLAFRS